MSEVCGFSTGVTIVHRSGGGAKGMGEVCVCVGGLGVQGEPLGNGNPTSDLGVTSDPESLAFVKLSTYCGKLPGAIC